MKILHILNYVGRGGSESYIKNLANTKNKNINYELIYNIDGGGLEDFKKLGIKTTQFDMKPFDIKAAKFLKKYVKENKIDLVHTHFMRENGILFLAKLIGLKVSSINTRHMVNKIGKKAAILNRIFFTKNNHVIAVSSIVRDNLIKEGLNKDKIIILPPPFPIVENVGKIEKDDSEKWIISVGRISHEKGTDFFVDAIQELFKDSRFDNYKAIIIGYGDMEENIKKKINEYNLHDKIKMLGYIKNPYPYLKESELYVNHSYEEAFGLSIVEAAYNNTPLLIPENAGATDFFNDENKSAVLYKMGSVDDFVNKAKKILNDENLKNTIVENAANIVENDITREKIIHIMEKIYEGEINGNKKN